MRNPDRDSTAPDYPTDEFGRPDGRDFHYRVPLGDEPAATLAMMALKGMGRYDERFVARWKDYSARKPGAYIGLETHDSKGHLAGLAEYAHSPAWEDVSDRVSTDVDEFRQNPTGRGTKFRGTVDVDPTGDGVYRSVEYDAVVTTVTPSEFRDALMGGDGSDDVRDAIHFAQRDAADEYRRRRAEAQRECEHVHFVRFDEVDHGHPHDPRAVGYCEDCGAEVSDDGDVVWG